MKDRWKHLSFFLSLHEQNFMERLKDKVAIVTGATRGIGKSIAETFIKEGAKVYFTYVSSDEKAKALESSLGNNAKALKFDVADFDACQEAISSILKAEGKIDVLINNAGITKDGLLMRMTQDQWEAVIRTNLNSAFNMVKAVQRTMLKQRSGSIVNMTSVVGIKGNAGQANYAASKAGLIGFTKSVALELGSRNIRSNAVAPGFIETEMTGALDADTVQSWRDAIPLKRGGTPEDVANLTLFLASEESSYITGQVFNVDGGMLT